MNIKKFFPKSFDINENIKNTLPDIAEEKKDIQKRKTETGKTYEDGFQEGIKYEKYYNQNKKRVTADSKTLDLLESISNALSQYQKEELNKSKKIKTESIKLVKECIEILFPYLQEEFQAKNLFNFIISTITSLKKDSKIFLYLSKNDYQKIFDKLIKKFSFITICYQTDMQEGECKITWDGGWTSWNAGDVYKKLSNFLNDECNKSLCEYDKM